MNRFLSRLIVAGFTGLTALSSWAAPFDKTISFTQPDGTVIQLRGKGDEFSATFETLAGYTVVFNPATKTYEYAQRTPDGNDLVGTGAVVGQVDPATLGLDPHVKMNREAMLAKARARWEKWDRATGLSERWKARKAANARADALAQSAAARGEPAPLAAYPTITGTKVGLCLLIDFSDAPGTIPQATIDAYCNGDSFTGYGNNGSVKKYYYDNSGGMLTYSNVVTVYVRVPRPKSYYNDTSKDCGSQGNLLIRDAIAAMRAMPDYTNSILPTFANLTVDGANQAVACNVFFAGGNSGVWTWGLWPHSWSLWEVGAQELTTGGIKVWNYQITDIGSSLELGTFCHENGHMLCDYPDIYDYDYDSVGGAGYFCLMDYGGNGGNPVQICAYLKRASGWSVTTDLTYGSYTKGFLSAPAGTNFNHFYRYQKPGVPTEYYLLENRQKTGRDANISASGIAIWHIDELGDRDNQSLAYNTTHKNYEVTLMQADNLWHFQNNVNGGDARDLYYSGNSAAGYSNRFADDTGPSAKWWSGQNSEIDFKNFSLAGPDMTADLIIGPTAILLQHVSLVGESCLPTNGVIDPGETVTIEVAIRSFLPWTTTNLIGTLLTNGGVFGVGAPYSFGVVDGGGGPVVTGLFSYVANGACGGLISNVVQLTDGTNSAGSVTFNWLLGMPTTNVGITLAENFDTVTAPAIPGGWTTTFSGLQPPWKTSAFTPDSGPNCAFTPDNNGIGENALVSPLISVLSANSLLSFRHYYKFHAPATGTNGYDGGVLEIKIGESPWQDVIAAGGTFTTGAYNRTLSSRNGNPIGGRAAWSGDSLGYVDTAVILPSAAIGQFCRLRWRSGTDESIGSAGWRVDGIVLVDAVYECCGGTDLALSMDSMPHVAVAGQPVLFTLLVTNNGSAGAAGVVISNALPAHVAFAAATASAGGCVFTNGSIICDLGALAAGATATADILLTPSNQPPLIFAITNDAIVKTIVGDSALTNNAASAVVIVYKDSVGDGIPDWWRDQHFGGGGTNITSTNCAACDPDGDGRTNLEEFQSDTTPTNAASLLRIVALSNEPPSALTFFPSSTGRVYTLQTSSDMLTGSWTTVTGQIGVPGSGSVTNLTDTNAPAANFYRIKATLP